MTVSPRLRRWILVIAITVQVVGLLLWALPVGLREAGEWWLGEHGVTASIEDIDLNVFTGIARVSNASGRNAAGDGFQIGRAEVELHWRSIFRKRLHLLHAALLDSRLDLRQDDRQLISILGLNPAEFVSQQADDDAEPLLDFGLDRLLLSDVVVHWEAPAFSEDLKLDTGGVLDFASWAPTDPVPVDIQAELAGGALGIQGEMKPFADHFEATFVVSANALDLGVFAPLLRLVDVASFAGVLDSRLNIAVWSLADDYRLSVDGPLKLAGARLGLSDVQKYAAGLDWQGDIEVEGGAAQLKLNLAGGLAATDIAVQQNELAFTQDALTWDGKVDVARGATTQLSAKGALQGSPLSLQQGETLALSRLAPVADIDINISQGSETSVVFDSTLASPDWQLRLDGADFQGGQIDLKATGRVDVAGMEKPSLQADVQLAGAALKLLPDAATSVLAEALNWQGSVTSGLTAPFATIASGVLSLSDSKVGFDGGQTKLTGLTWDGAVEVLLPTAKRLTTDIKGDGLLAVSDSAYLQGDASKPLVEAGAGAVSYTGAWSLRLDPGVATDGNEARPTTEITMPGAVAGSKLYWALAATDQSGKLNRLGWQGGINATLSDTTAYRLDGRLSAEGLLHQLADPDYSIQQASLNWQGVVDQPPASEPGAPNLTGRLIGNGTRVQDRSVGRDLITLNSLELNGVSMNGESQITADNLLLSELAALRRKPPPDATSSRIVPNVVAVTSADIQQISLSNLQRLTIAEVLVDGLDTWLSRSADGSLEFAEWFSEGGAADQPVASATADATDAPSFSWAIGKLDVEGDSRFRFRDRSVKPRFGEDLTALSVQMSAVDSAAVNQKTTLNVSATIGSRGILTLAGPMQPLQPRPSFNLKGRIEGVDLSTLSPYSAQAIGHGVRQGTVNADVRLLSKTGALNSKVDLKLSKLKLERAQDAEGLEGGLGMPLNQALGLLRDRQDNITLSLPITGDIEDPSFSPRDVVRQAVMKAIQFAVINFYSPLGVVFAAEKLVDLATAVKFEPIEFAPAAVELAKSEQEYLAKLSKLMTDRPGMEIVACGYAIPADRDARLIQIEEEKSVFAKLRDIGDDRTSEEIVPDEDLLRMATQRVDSVADYLIAQGIDRKRLVNCASKLDAKPDAKGRVEFSF